MATDLEVEEEVSVTRQTLASRPTLRHAAATAVFSQSVAREMGLRSSESIATSQFSVRRVNRSPRRVGDAPRAMDQLRPEPETRRGVAASSVGAVSDLYTT